MSKSKLEQLGGYAVVVAVAIVFSAVAALASGGRLAGQSYGFTTSAGSNVLLKSDGTGANAVASKILDDGTTATLGTSAAIVTEATGEVTLNAGTTTPQQNQFLVESSGTSSGTMGIKVYGPDNAQLQFDEYTSGGVNYASFSSVAVINKTSSQMRIYGATGQTVGAAVSLGERWAVDLGTGAMFVTGGMYQGTSTSAISWTTGTGAPAGSCTTGSLYTRTDGGASTTLYVCQAAAWAAK